MRNSATNWFSAPVNLPSCDAWALASVSSTATTIASSGASVTRPTTGTYTATFSNPSRFGGGGYCVLSTIEAVNDSGYAALSFPSLAAGATAAFSTSSVQFKTWSYGVPSPGGCTASVADLPTGQYRVNFAAFCFSQDSQLRVVEGGTFAIIPGASGFGVTGATYNSALPNLNTTRTTTAYGTVVIPPIGGSSSVCAYVENSHNVLGVSAGANGVFDITFNKPLNSADYCVLLTSECETATPANINSDLSPLQEASLLLVRAGASNQFKTRNGFRIENRKQNPTNNGWEPSNAVYGNGLTERIHFMVFGGGTYGQP